ncbi:uncharacterized protein LOC131950794 isoform X2 [Physella acuta]|uniref:uncharacterized protein LOC131950794 isoform X2 n=1 Tax=Physella acuta TaxID=109671 RepID=UPI0027DB9AE9|nr:uncharacterized protein LOC131950794 isoform X2 [Physella acuta]
MATREIENIGENGDYEVEVSFEGGKSLSIFQQCWKKCKKRPDHNDFIPISTLRVDHLPDNFKDPDIISVIRCLSYLTVNINVLGASESRPENHNGKPYPRYSNIAPDMTRTGTGKIHTISIYPDDGDENCHCKKCKNDQIITKIWGKVFILTAMHVVFDKFEAENTTCIWGHNTESCKVANLEGVDIRKATLMNDMCLFECVTHDVDLLKKLKGTIDLYTSHCAQVYEKFKHGPDKSLIILVSHPHGCAKHVSIGKILTREKLPNEDTRYTYDAPTCNGCSGAPVYVLEKKNGWWTTHVHSGSVVTGGSISGLTWL